MFSSTLALAAALSLVAARPIEPGTQLTYSGTMSGVKDDGNPAVKEFMLALVAIGGEGESIDFAWALEETGRGGWTWLDHFGKWTVPPPQNTSDASAPALTAGGALAVTASGGL